MPKREKVESYKICPTCKKYCKHYSINHGSFYCKECDIWLEPLCNLSLVECTMCTGRPEKPSQSASYGE